jgi:hypothetical protein
MMKKKQPSWPSSETRPVPTTGNTPTGTGLSTTGSDQATPAQTSSSVVALKTLDLSRDREAASSLPPALASCLEEQLGPEYDLERYTINDGGQLALEVLTEGRTAILGLSEPAPDDMILRALLKLRSLTASRGIGDADLDMTLEAYAEKLKEYPADATIQALGEAPDRSKWFPTWHDLKTRIHYLSQHRRLILEAIDRKIAKLEPRSSVAGLVRKALHHG